LKSQKSDLEKHYLLIIISVPLEQTTFPFGIFLLKTTETF